MFGWLFLWQNVKVLTSLLPMITSFLLYHSVYAGFLEINSNFASVTSNFCLGLRQFECTAAQSLRFRQKMILGVFLLINFNIITGICLNKTTLILFVAFLLSVSL